MLEEAFTFNFVDILAKKKFTTDKSQMAHILSLAYLNSKKLSIICETAMGLFFVYIKNILYSEFSFEIQYYKIFRITLITWKKHIFVQCFVTLNKQAKDLKICKK